MKNTFFDPMTLWLAGCLREGRRYAEEAHRESAEERRMALHFVLLAADVATRTWSADDAPCTPAPTWGHFDLAAWLAELRREPDWGPDHQAAAVASLLGWFTFLHRRRLLSAEVAARHLCALEHHVNEPLRRRGYRPRFRALPASAQDLAA
ncbi:MAG: hypothetical protein AAGN82_20340 [Myxococcota bacterium]